MPDPATEMDSAVQEEDVEEEKGGGCCGSAAFKKAQSDNTILNIRRGLCPCLPFTDILVLVAFVAFFIGMLYVFGWSMENGDMDRIAYGSDYKGDVCGGDYKHQYWPNPLYYNYMGSICLDSCPDNTTAFGASGGGSVFCTCNNKLTIGRGSTLTGTTSFDSSQVNDALNENGSRDWLLAKDCFDDTMATTSNAARKKGTWVRYDSVSESASLVTNFLTSAKGSSIYYFLASGWMAEYGISGTNADGKYMVPNCMWGYETTKVLNRCIPKIPDYSTFCYSNSSAPSWCPDSSAYKDQLNDFSNSAATVLEDCWTCIGVILGAFPIAVVCGFLFIYFMEKCAKCVVWCVIFIALVFSGVIALACYLFGAHLQSQADETPQPANYDTYKRNMWVCYVFAIIFGVIFAIILCTAVCFCRQINQAATLIQLASDAFLDFPYLLFYPIGQIVGLFCLVVAWCPGAAMLASAGTQQTDDTYGYAQWTYSDDLKYMMWYWLFGLLWIGELMLACGFMIVAFCFAIWFFSEEIVLEDGSKKERKEQSCSSCCLSLCCCCCGYGEPPEPVRAVPDFVLYWACRFTWFNHLGTVTFGALIMAIIDMARIVLEYIEQKKKEYEKAGGEIPLKQLWEFIFCCMRTCLWCLDCCMRFLNKNAYIQTAINGTDLCASACRAVTVMLVNLALFAIMTGIQAGIFFFGKLAISFGTGGVCGMIIYAAYQDSISSAIVPVLICILIGYGVSSAFICVYDMGIDTMLMCYAEATCKQSIVANCCSCCCKTSEGQEGTSYHIPHELTGQVEEARKTMDENNAKDQERAQKQLDAAKAASEPGAV